MGKYLHQFEMYKTNDINMDALCLTPEPFARSVCIRHHHPPKQHLSLNILRRSSTRCFAILLRIPEKNDIYMNSRVNWHQQPEATHFSKTALSQYSQKVKIFYIVLPKAWNNRGWRSELTGFLELRISIRRLCKTF